MEITLRAYTDEWQIEGRPQDVWPVAEERCRDYKSPVRIEDVTDGNRPIGWFDWCYVAKRSIWRST